MSTLSLQELLDKVRSGLMVRTHSAAVRPGEAFVALPGTKHDGGAFVSDALARGASCIVAGRGVSLPDGSSASLVGVADPRTALGELARAYFDTDGHKMSLVGITGTNGKTTSAYLTESLLLASGHAAGLLGTVAYRWPGHSEDASRTTPDCWSLHSMFAGMAKAGVDTVVMEVSSHAIDQQRIAGLSYDTAVLTNLTQDHLDYHKDMESYFQVKARLFLELPRQGKTSVVNLDDPYGRRLAEMIRARGGQGSFIGYTLGEEAKGSDVLRGEVLSMGRTGLILRMHYKGRAWDLTSPLVGRHNAQNILAAAGAGLSLGLAPAALAALSEARGAPGRLERVANSRGLHIFVDYAHTPDALENVQRALKALDFRRLIVVFGCGGDRDRTKRPLMGQAVARYADIAVLTSDNPRSEDPAAIMAEVMPGLRMSTNGFRVVTEPDRKKALALAVAEMKPGDALLVAGKGHENYQIIGDEKRHFSDVEAIREIVG